ncbi:hypothetical protein WN48_06143 [Eufriesea mexicana]|uniref:Uncharacterized protein n=1 Tax=Eufriesea mexicana TaxID=516756 RepID=A0A310SPX2_9HYME|nr:hypothetical protein WN48_06143 [Eufriesea mexicana]
MTPRRWMSDIGSVNERRENAEERVGMSRFSVLPFDSLAELRSNHEERGTR